ncbi:MAG: thioredoxin-like domain-containing protein, partial [Planctomycetota bacterium]
MKRSNSRLNPSSFLSSLVGLALLSILAPAALAASPTAEQALKLTPVQKGIDYSTVEPAEVAKCAMAPQKFDGKVGWVVRDPQGVVLRVFLDTNGDNIVDQWSYYRDGLEVYRDIDSDFNGKADSYRWFTTAGTRWGEDSNEDGKIDAWKAISPEEVTAEVVAALGAGDVERFVRVALSADELKSLGLGPAQEKELAARLPGLAAEFGKLAASQKAITPATKWTHFSGLMPGVVPAGTEGSKHDLHVYENVSAITETGSTSSQVSIGTMVRVGDTWKLINVPQVGDEGAELAGGFFFQPAAVSRPELAGGMPSDAMQKLLSDLEALDRKGAAATTAEEQTAYTAQRADLLEKIASEARGDDRAMWIRQAADMISAAVQQAAYPAGPERLAAMYERLENSDKDLAAYVKFRQLMAEYVLASQTAKGTEFGKVQEKWLKDVEQYVSEFPDSPDAAEAMLQLGISQEFAGEEDTAKQWYQRIVKDFANSPQSLKANGALTRLDSVGKVIRVSGKTASGGSVDLANLRGKPVVIHYWATWSRAALDDMEGLKSMLQRYGNAFNVLGINLDVDTQGMAQYVAQSKVPWPQIHEDGGLDSRPANQLGILSVPTMILVDKQGRVVSRGLPMAELEDELKK